MMKRIFCILTAVLMISFAAGAAADEPAALTSAELNPVAEAMKSAALASSPLNDPAACSHSSANSTMSLMVMSLQVFG